MIVRKSAVGTVLAIFFFTFLPFSLQADEVDGSAVIQLLEGKDHEGKKQITVAEIEALGVSTLEIDDPFEKKKCSFTGVMMEKFVTRYGSTGVKSVTFKGIDGYEVTFSSSDWGSHKIMIVTRVNGNFMDYEHKGPLRIVYPNYDPKKHKSKEILPKWIWMITSVQFR